MKQAQTDAKEMIAEIDREPGRSSLFWDFYDNHAAMLRAKGVGRFHWKDLTARVSARGLTDANGNAPDQQTTKKTWHRVCQLLQYAPIRAYAALVTVESASHRGIPGQCNQVISPDRLLL